MCFLFSHVVSPSYVNCSYEVISEVSKERFEFQVWKLNDSSSVIHCSSGVSSNYSLFFLSSCWLFIIHSRLFFIPLTWLFYSLFLL